MKAFKTKACISFGSICLLLTFTNYAVPASGQTFRDKINLGENIGGLCPIISVSSNNVYVAWRSFDIGDGDIIFSKSTDGGITFSHPIDLSTSSESADCPHMTVSGNNVYIVWNEAIPSSFGSPVFFRSRFDGGVTFNPLKKLSNNDDEDETPHPLVAASGKKPGYMIFLILLRRFSEGPWMVAEHLVV